MPTNRPTVLGCALTLFVLLGILLASYAGTRALVTLSESAPYADSTDAIALAFWLGFGVAWMGMTRRRPDPSVRWTAAYRYGWRARRADIARDPSGQVVADGMTAAFQQGWDDADGEG